MIFLYEVILFTKKKCSRRLDVFRSLKYIEKHWRDYIYDSRCPLVTDHIRVCDPKLSTISVILELLSKPWYWPQTTRKSSESFHAFTTLMGETSVDLHHGPSVVGNYGPQGCLKHFIIDLEHFNCIEINNVPLNLINHGNYAFSLKKIYCFLRFVLNWGNLREFNVCCSLFAQNLRVLGADIDPDYFLACDPKIFIWSWKKWRKVKTAGTKGSTLICSLLWQWWMKFM